MEFKDKFIGFVDILGWKEKVKAVENETGMPLPELIELLRNLGSREDEVKIKKNGPSICPQSKYLQRDLSFKLTQKSDCVIVSSEVSPAGVINLIGHCWGAVINLLQKGIMCRGYITRGSIYHTDNDFIGSGYHEAYSKEANVTAFKREANERGTPFVEVDPIVCSYVKDCKDPCVKKMFSRMVKDDGVVTALFPFKRLTHSFMIGGFGIKFDVQKEKNANQNMRLSIKKLKERVMEFVDESNASAVRKSEHYIEALNAQLVVCDKTDEMINMFSSPVPSRQFKGLNQ